MSCQNSQMLDKWYFFRLQTSFLSCQNRTFFDGFGCYTKIFYNWYIKMLSWLYNTFWTVLSKMWKWLSIYCFLFWFDRVLLFLITYSILVTNVLQIIQLFLLGTTINCYKICLFVWLPCKSILDVHCMFVKKIKCIKFISLKQF